MKIVIDPGHGGTDTGAIYQSHQEKNYNLSLALAVQRELRNRYEVEIVMTRTKDETVSLENRTNFANSENADFFLSIHHNAAGGRGFESYIYNGPLAPSTQQYQSIIHDRIVNNLTSEYGIRDRGKKRANFHVLRETDMSALLLEILFIDNPDDLKLITNSAFRSDTANAIAQGVASALKLPVKQQPEEPGVLYKVIAGSFTERENAQNRINFLDEKGIDSFMVPATISGRQYFRVQAGAFADRQNAETQVERLGNVGITDAFILTQGEEVSAPPSPEDGFSIEGESRLLAHQLDEFVKTINKDAPLLGEFYIKYGNAYGIRGDTAYAQAIHETDYFRFTGIVNEDQNNFAGIGATGPNNPGASFDTMEDGVHAHIQHLYAYTSKDPIPSGLQKIDPRFDLVARGSAQTWTQLNGKWAVPGTNYGQSILSIFRRNIEHAMTQIEKQRDQLEDLLDKI
ncbi:N-acetylmuramoyl-L-alanine amidase [Sediminibacillus massiliensis]|uniref:N-acetylmuramoyl-L-alanine amidase n=1 Tax=Sediminibacillus massiliensis TaxID=1926277 RepID=UPI000988944C|nr:N-acetylmuramoyl-L-alanine amidase [Sediminibacillus massiliensis]